MVLIVKDLPANAGDLRDASWIWSERSPGGGNGNLLQYSCLENPMDTGAWRGIQSVVSQKGKQLDTQSLALCFIHSSVCLSIPIRVHF